VGGWGTTKEFPNLTPGDETNGGLPAGPRPGIPRDPKTNRFAGPKGWARLGWLFRGTCGAEK